jgi:hypothetical protein
MAESAVCAIGVVFALCGLYYVTERLYKYFMCEKNSKDIYTVIFHFEEEEHLPDKVYTAMLMSEYKSFGKREIYVVDNNFSHHIRLRCQLITAEMGTVHFISYRELRFLYKINSDND